MVDHGSMRPSLQLIGDQFSNFLLRKLPCEFKLVDIARISNGHISGLLQGKVTWSGKLVVLYVLRMLI